MIRIQPPRLLKAWSMILHPPEGPVNVRNPPAPTFRPPHEPDIPAFAHNGRGDVIEGEFDSSSGPLAYKTQHGNFYHGIDALAMQLADFLNKTGKGDIDPIAVINKAIDNFNRSHTHGHHHELPPFDNLAWRKIRANQLPAGTTSKDENGKEITDRQSRTHNNTLITTLTNKNPDQTPHGRFIESYYIPFHQNLFHLLQDMGYEDRQIKGALKSGVTYPYVYAKHTAPQGWAYSSKGEHPDTYTSEMMGNAPDDYFPEQQSVHTWETVHHLPDIFFYPSRSMDKDIMSGGQAPTKLVAAAHAMIDQALEQGGIESIPNVPVTLNTGTLGAPNMIQRPLREILGNKDLKEALVKDMAHVPALMYLFGRSYQGNFKKLYDYMMTKFGAPEDELSAEEHGKYFRAGEKGGQGLHKNAKRVMSVARSSGRGENESRSKFGEHQITSDELEAAGLPYNEQRLEQVDRFRNVIEALANHQAEARGHTVQMGIGEIPTEPMRMQNIHGYPIRDPETGEFPAPILDEHMEAYFHTIDDFAPNKEGMSQPEGVPPVEQARTPPPVPAPQQNRPVVQPAGTPTPEFQQLRPGIADFTPAQFREMLQIAGATRPQPISDAPLTELEARSQQALSDPRQRLLTDYMKAEDMHLPLMDRLMKALERMQYKEASLDGDVSSHITPSLQSPVNLAKYTGLTSSEVTAIQHTMGDWHNIAKSYNVKPQVVKIIKMNLR